MPFVKIDVGILNSSLWIDLAARNIFMTALLMAEPFELREPAAQIELRSLAPTGWTVPTGWYGFARASGLGIVDRAKLSVEDGYAALEKLGAPEIESRSNAFEGRRLVRVDGGFIILNYITYRERDYGSAERMQRMRDRKKMQRNASPVTSHVTPKTGLLRNITQAEAEAEADPSTHQWANTIMPPPAVLEFMSTSDSQSPKPLPYQRSFDRFWAIYPKKKGKDTAFKAWVRRKPDVALVATILAAVEKQKTWPEWLKDGGEFVPNPATWVNAGRWNDEPHQPLKNVRAGKHYDRAAAMRIPDEVE
jgi:hypothetical protein